MVGNGNGLLANAVHVRNQLIDVASAVQQGIISVQVKMGELSHGVCLF
jgi:hypothetical protein